MHFVSSGIYFKAVKLALSEGLSEYLILHHRNSAEIQKDSKYIPIKYLFEIYELAGKHLKPGFSIRQGRQLNTDDYGTLGLSWKTCWILKDVFRRLLRYMVLVTDQGSAELNETKDFMQIILVREPASVGLEMANETTFVMLLNILNEISTDGIKPYKVSFQHRSKYSELFENHFQCEVLFGSEENMMEFYSTDLEQPTSKADESLQKFLIERMEEERNQIHINTDKLLKDVHNIINDALPGGIPSLMECAEHLGMSARTLKRRLADKNLSFREMIRESQLESSKYMLRNSSMSIAEIAFQIGFSEQSAFNRAFKRWTDQSPLEYRNKP